MMLPVFLLCTVMLATAQNDSTGEEDEYYTPNRKTFCEKNDQELYKDMEECFQGEDQSIKHAHRDCAFVAVPDSNGNNIEFFNAACKDTTLFKKFDKCLEEYENDEEYKTQMVISADVQECYKEVFDKYEIEMR